MTNCLVCTVDSLRYDGIDALDADNGLLTEMGLIEQLETPNMDRLVNAGTTLPNLHAPYGSTPTSTASLLTGLYPREHGAYDYHRPLNSDVMTLGKRFSDAGFHTIIMNGHFFFGEMGLGDQFDEILHGPASLLIERIEELNDRDKDVFAYYHTMDVHHPYLISKFPPDLEYNDAAIGVANQLLDHLGEEKQFGRGDANARAKDCDFEYMTSPELPVWKFLQEYVVNHYRREETLFEDPILERAKLYVGGISRFDQRQFAPVVEYVLDESDDRETTLILTSDHGQVPREMDESGNKRTFYHRGKPVEELIRVPGIVYSNHLNVEAKHTLTSLVDIAPSLVDLFDLPGEREVFSGINLFSSVNERSYIYAEFSRTVTSSGGRDLERERVFPLPGVLKWSSLLTPGGLKFYTDTLNVSLQDLELQPQDFVRVVFEKLHNIWLSQADLESEVDTLNELNGDRGDYVHHQQETLGSDHSQVFDWKNDVLEEKPLSPGQYSEADAEEWRTHLSSRFLVNSQLTEDDVSGLDESQREEKIGKLEGFGYL